MAKRHKGLSIKQKGRQMILDAKYITKVCELQAVLLAMGIPKDICQEIAYKLNQLVEDAMENTPL